MVGMQFTLSFEYDVPPSAPILLFVLISRASISEEMYIRVQMAQTFKFRKLVITLTASADRGTGEPYPISSPVSRGRGLDFDDPPSASVSTGRAWALSSFALSSVGSSGAVRVSLGTVSMPFRPRLSPYMMRVA